jgi:hypothetical protein
MMIVLENLLDMIGGPPVSFRPFALAQDQLQPESRLDYFAWIPARAALGRDDAVGWNDWNIWND